MILPAGGRFITINRYYEYHNGLHDRTWKLDAIIETELSHNYMAILKYPKMVPALESGCIIVIITFLIRKWLHFTIPGITSFLPPLTSHTETQHPPTEATAAHLLSLILPAGPTSPE